MKITNYQKIKSLNPDSLFLVDGATGTKTILAPDLARELLAQLSTRQRFAGISLVELDGLPFEEYRNKSIVTGDHSGNYRMVLNDDGIYILLNLRDGHELRRSICRGQNLGDHVTDEQWEEIRTGRFRNMFLGDYWEIGGNKWRIIDFNYWMYKGDTHIDTGYHLVISPQNSLYVEQMNTTNSTVGAYMSSKMRTSGLNRAKEIINNTFGEEHIYRRRAFLPNSINSQGGPAGHVWVNSEVELFGECQLLGASLYSSKTLSEPTNIDNAEIEQFALFSINSNFINSYRYTFWLRDTGGPTNYEVVHPSGAIAGMAAAERMNVKPVFGLTVR